MFVPAPDAEGQSKDHGYVNFKSSDDAAKALAAMNKKQLGEDKFLIVN